MLFRAGLCITCFVIVAFGISGPASAEWYVAGEAGVNFADRLANISGTGILAGVVPRDQSFDLAIRSATVPSSDTFPSTAGSASRAKSSTALRISRDWITVPGSICE